MARLLILVTALLASAVSAFSCSQPALVATQRPAASSVVVGDVRVSPEAIVMAVPKKRQSKMKTRQRKANVRAPPPNAHSPRTHTRNLVR